jgi:hypothetical protein
MCVRESLREFESLRESERETERETERVIESNRE